MLGQLGDDELRGKHSSFKDEGNCLFHLSMPIVHFQSFRYSILPALSLDGIITIDIVEGSYNKLLFAKFIDGLLDQMSLFPADNSVIVMDNCRIHKCPEVLEMITNRLELYFV